MAMSTAPAELALSRFGAGATKAPPDPAPFRTNPITITYINNNGHYYINATFKKKTIYLCREEEAKEAGRQRQRKNEVEVENSASAPSNATQL